MAGNGDMQAHEQTYHSVMNLFKYGAVICFLIALFVVWLIAA